jgi:hypothetical protein
MKSHVPHIRILSGAHDTDTIILDFCELSSLISLSFVNRSMYHHAKVRTPRAMESIIERFPLVCPEGRCDPHICIPNMTYTSMESVFGYKKKSTTCNQKYGCNHTTFACIPSKKYYTGILKTKNRMIRQYQILKSVTVKDTYRQKHKLELIKIDYYGQIKSHIRYLLYELRALQHKLMGNQHQLSFFRHFVSHVGLDSILLSKKRKVDILMKDPCVYFERPPTKRRRTGQNSWVGTKNVVEL